MKRLTTIFLISITLVLIMTVGAYAASLEYSYNYENDILSVSGSFEPEKNVYIYILDKDVDIAELGADGKSVKDIAVVCCDENGEYKYATAINNTLKGKYNIVIKSEGYGEIVKPAIFYYPDSLVTENIINAFYDGTEADIKACITNLDNIKYLQIDNFIPFTDTDKGLLSKTIASIFDNKIKSEDSRQNMDTIIKTIKVCSVLSAYNTGKENIVYDDGKISYQSILGLDTLDKDGVTIKNVYDTILSEDAKSEVRSSMLNNNITSLEEFTEKFAEAVILNGLPSPKAAGSGHVNKILTPGNCNFVKMPYNSISTIKEYKVAELPKQNSLSELDTKIKQILAQPETTGGATGGGGGGGGGSLPTPGQNAIAPVTPNIIPTDNKVYKHNFTDIDDFEWAEEAISYLYTEGIVSGTSENTFAPAETLTREQFAKVLCILKGIEVKENDKFDDVEAGTWYAPYIGALSDAGLVSGVVEGTFGVGYNITREDLCVMVYRAFSDKIKAIKTKTFTDSDSINSYALDAVNALSGAGILNGFEDGSFKPQADCTRAEMAKIVYEIAQLIK